MSRADRPPRDRPDAGFTVLEVLIALAIIAISIFSIGSVMSTNSRGVTTLENHVALVGAAQAVLTTAIPQHNELAPGVRAGELRNYRWQLDVSPIGGDWEPQDDSKVTWTPELVRIHVRSPTGAQLDLSTVRLMPRRPQ
ncbi:prepilin-type N-terminal cleavage/methylation domain-containing protein [Bradyrhizobium sp. KB893862 SZCCT0404]|uniref:prepilin-type N-terminal cleavage/methylation domain-containing protein n=1 Tax=Bradyrhizobium sp. KB893862 SZCCT0404 TaxID=2807672 RepID=UPI001BA8181D|nr:prepilin-type N-terminal cleavage/methylation domain-containing protein [Bradyrhizobium sp. KB893862 SZCCT0404]MBR1175260.1 prepilin-type N-terminal cleavage/methylation domain-containing protein [Bradyrhizobium sp. KB893862 SZCCT0404]